MFTCDTEYEDHFWRFYSRSFESKCVELLNHHYKMKHLQVTVDNFEHFLSLTLKIIHRPSLIVTILRCNLDFFWLVFCCRCKPKLSNIKFESISVCNMVLYVVNNQQPVREGSRRKV